MAATKYTYSITNDFPNSTVNSTKLTNEIQISAVSGTLDYINTNSDNCDIWFLDTLTSGDESTLGGTVSSHDGIASTSLTEAVTDYEYTESAGESSTTDTAWQEKLDINISNIQAGNYKVVWFFEWAYSRVRDPGANYGIHVDWGADTLSETEMTPTQTYGDGAFYGQVGFGYTILTAGNHKIALNYSSGVGTATAYIRRAGIEVWRIS